MAALASLQYKLHKWSREQNMELFKDFPNYCGRLPEWSKSPKRAQKFYKLSTRKTRRNFNSFSSLILLFCDGTHSSSSWSKKNHSNCISETIFQEIKFWLKFPQTRQSGSVQTFQIIHFRCHKERDKKWKFHYENSLRFPHGKHTPAIK